MNALALQKVQPEVVWRNCGFWWLEGMEEVGKRSYGWRDKA